jgi:hypothetical protein
MSVLPPCALKLWMAQRAYTAYVQLLTTLPAPLWSDLDSSVQKAWIAAILATHGNLT